MQIVDYKSFFRSLVIQRRVIGALILREIITRYGRGNIGFLWLFVEPIVIILTLSLIWQYVRGDVVEGVAVIPFLLTGYPISMMWRNASSRAIQAMTSNSSLLYHRNVKPLDIYFSRMLLEISGVSIAFLVIFMIFFVYDKVDYPNDILLMFVAWILMAWFSIGWGMIIGVVSERLEFFGHAWRSVSFILFPLSGVFYLVGHLPVIAQKILLFVPMIHGTEMMRHGYFGEIVKTHESIGYLVLSNIVIFYLGLMLVRRQGRGVEQT